MSALSTSMIMASNGVGAPAGKMSPRGDDKTTGTQPFAAMLAATSQQTPAPKPQSDPPSAVQDNNHIMAKAAGTQIDTVQVDNAQADTAATTSQSAPKPRDGKTDSKDDKKSDGDDDTDVTVAVSTQQPGQSAQNLPSMQTQASLALMQAAAQAAPPAVAQTPVTTGGDKNADTGNVISTSGTVNGNGGKPAAQAPAGNTSVRNNTPSQAAASPAGGNAGPVAQNPALAQAAVSDDGDEIADSGNTVSATVTTSVTKSGKDAKPSAPAQPGNTPANKAAPRVAPQATAPAPAADDDAEPAAPAESTAAIGTQTQSAFIAAGSGGTLAGIADATPAAQAPAEKPAAKSAAQTAANAATDSKPAPSAATVPAPQAPAVATDSAAQDPAQNSGAAQTASKSSDADKPAHVSASDAAPQPQPQAPTPVAQIVTPANAAPQGIVTVNADGTTAQPGGNATVATSVHIAAAGTDTTPNMDALAVTIAARSVSGAKQFEIRLDPPELGRVDVRLSIDDSGKAQAHLTADQPQTLGLLQKDAPTLTQALRNAGLDVSQSGLNFSLRGQDRQNSDKNGGDGQGRRTNLTATRAITAAQGAAAVSFNGAAADARIDIHV